MKGESVYCDNFRFGWRFFPRNISRYFTPFTLPRDKSDKSFRVFVLGASAAKGTPEPAYGFSQFLRVMLKQQYPDVDFEIITAAMVAINSHVVLEIAEQCACHEPDLFIVYLGNNEVIGPYGAGTVFGSISGNLSLIRAGIAVKSTRLGQLAASLSRLLGGRGNAPSFWGGLDMFMEKQVRADSAKLETVYDHFERNLEDILRAAGECGAETILCTVGSNLRDNPPFASLNRPDLSDGEKQQWNNMYEQGITHQINGDTDEAIADYLSAEAIDGSYADLQFQLGRCYWAQGKFEKARDRYIMARDLDTLRFRADSRINQIIRDVGHKHKGKGVWLLDPVKAFEQNSPHNTTGEELFYEHVHLNFKGNYVLAKAVFEQVEKLLGEGPGSAERKFPDEAKCAKMLAFTQWNQYEAKNALLTQFTTEAPFGNQLYHEQRLEKLRQSIATLEAILAGGGIERAAAEYEQAISADEGNWQLRWKYGELLSDGMHNYGAAIRQYSMVLDRMPHNFHARAALALNLALLGELKESVKQNLIVIETNPEFYKSYFNLGSAYIRLNEPEKAIECLYGVVRLQPMHNEAYKNLGGLLILQGRLKEAEKILRQGLKLFKNDDDLHHNLNIALNKQGRKL